MIAQSQPTACSQRRASNTTKGHCAASAPTKPRVGRVTKALGPCRCATCRQMMRAWGAADGGGLMAGGVQKHCHKSLRLQKCLHGICNVREIASALLLPLRSSMSNTKQQAVRAAWHGLHLHASNGGLPPRQLVLAHYNANHTAAPDVCWVRESEDK